VIEPSRSTAWCTASSRFVNIPPFFNIGEVLFKYHR
jgi:hypothetical protein